METLKPFKKFCITLGQLPTSYLESMSYYETLVWLCNYLNKTIEPSILETQEAVTELQNFINNYFDNLNVQDEINNKLDEMAESGELESIIASYLNVNSILAYNTNNDLINADNLVNGSFTKTYGRFTINDGNGAFYKIRPLVNTDVIDNNNILPLTNYPTLVAEKMRTETTYKMTQKFIKSTNAYYPEYNLESNKNHSLSLEGFYICENPFDIQGVVIDKKRGRLLGINSTTIGNYAPGLIDGLTPIFTGDYGHGGDSCIFEDYLYISDSSNNNIYKVNLLNGAKETISIDTSLINNPNTIANAKIGGICMDNINYCYLLVIDESISHASIDNNASIRIYKYYFANANLEKLYEELTTLCYAQGFTKDDEFFYFVGNKPFTDNYTGNELHILDINFNKIDVLENSFNGECEGLDYGFFNGVEGLATSIGNYGYNNITGLYSFGGNCTEARQVYNTNEDKIIIMTKSKGGHVTCYFKIWDTFTPGSKHNYPNVMVNAWPVRKKSSNTQIKGFCCGNNRNTLCQFVVDENGTLSFYMQNNTQETPFVEGTFEYECY